MYKSIIKPLPFCYSIVSQALAATTTIQPSFNISNDAPFVLTEIRGVIEKAAAFDNSVTMQIRTADGTLLSNAAIDMLSFARSNQLPGNGNPIYFPNVVIPENTTIEIQITNNCAAALLKVQVQLWGYKPNDE